MNMLKPLCYPVCIAAMFALGGSAFALVKGTTQQDTPYLAGGVGEEEREVIRQHASAFDLEVVTATRRGPYIADARVQITDRAGRSVLDTVIPGPILLVDLNPGAYRVRAEAQGQVQTTTVTIGEGGRRRVVLHFDLPAETLETLESGARRTPAPARGN